MKNSTSHHKRDPTTVVNLNASTSQGVHRILIFMIDTMLSDIHTSDSRSNSRSSVVVVVLNDGNTTILLLL